MATIKDIAKELQLGISTVSMALNDNPRIKEATKKLVLDKAKELGYIRNGSAVDLQKQKTNIILFVVTDASRSLFSKTIQAIQERVAYYDYDLLIATTQSSVRTAKRFISEHRADGVIVYTNQIEDDFLRAYAREDFPIFVMGHHVEGEHIYSDPLAADDSVGMATVNYLYDKGHRSIAFVKGSMSTLGTPRRLAGYKRALQLCGLPYREELVFDAKANTYEGGYQATMALIPKLPEIDAIYYANDDIALGGMRALQEQHIRIPEDVSIIGSNDLPESSLVSPGLTTTNIRSKESADLSVDYLMKAIQREPFAESEIFEWKKRNGEYVIERGTVKQK